MILRIGSLTWTKEELCRHILITGDTGSGKTTSGFQPILLQITRNVPNWGGLVLGVKGDEHRFITELAHAHNRENDLIHLEVRPPDSSTKWTPPHRYNLLSDRSIPWMTHAKIIVDIASSVTEGSQHAFFKPMAQISLSNAFELLDLLAQPVTITRAYELLTSRPVSERAIRSLQGRAQTVQIQKLTEFFDSTFTKAKAHEQREAVEGTLKTYLGFFLNSDVAAVFSSDEPNTFNFSDLDRGAIISITMPQTLATERRYVQTYLKILFYFHVLRRFDLDSSERDSKNLLLLIADEFQDLVTAAEDGISDHKTVDRIRAAGACIIAGMQSEISADPAITEKKRKVFSLNVRTRLIFRAADLEGATLSADFIGKKRIWKKTISSKPGSLARTISRRKEQEHYIHPTQLLRLPDHTAYAVHPSKRYIRKQIAPVDGEGKVFPWYR
ncbi:type IV secretion system DNA-binding domain-containing protein [Roseibacillus persicicus]|uniref:type IV secretory system conjugative DNA transfer family protein n=1 Tax=Roseibacillus persicicus TaxID=454148 RepID=UPI00398A928C